MSDLLTTLQIVRTIIDEKVITSADLAERFGISDRTLKRRLSHARGLGVAFLSYPREDKYIWSVSNAAEIEKAGTLNRWIELETEKTLLSRQA